MRSFLTLLAVFGGAGCEMSEAMTVDASVPDLAAHDGASPPDLSPLAPSGDMTWTRPFTWCSAPGSVVWSADGGAVVPGGAASPDLRFMKLPPGFCSHFFSHVPNARQLRFAPGGELFVAAPSRVTSSGGQGGAGAIFALTDDNEDGIAEAPLTFMDQIPGAYGLLFTARDFYFQDSARIMRLPYKAGDRAPSAAPSLVADISYYVSELHWPKAIDQADDGSIYVANGGDESETCDPLRPVHGAILQLDGKGGTTTIAVGLRNPISLRCPTGHNRCFALELARDYSAQIGGREKLLPVRASDDWGFPCCASKGLPYTDIKPIPDCGGVVAESGSFVIGDTPFSLDFERSGWPAPWTGSAFVVLHGSNGLWQNAKLIAISMDPATGLPLPSTDENGAPSGAMRDFATGWNLLQHQNGRPTEIAFGPDGRLYLSNDSNGDIIWISPVGI